MARHARVKSKTKTKRTKARRAKAGRAKAGRAAMPPPEFPTSGYGPMGAQFKSMLARAQTQPARRPARAPKFVFKVKGKTTHSCELDCMRCQWRTESGGQIAQCSRTNCRYVPFCWQHTQMLYKVKVAPTALEGFNFLGLFACAPEVAENAVLFKKDQKIIPYVGDRVTKRELDERYAGDYTAPYALQAPGVGYLDAACVRTAAAYANHRARPNAKLMSHAGEFGVIVATRDIRNDEEIYVSYGDDYRFDEPGVQHATQHARARLAPCKPRARGRPQLVRYEWSSQGTAPYVFRRKRAR